MVKIAKVLMVQGTTSGAGKSTVVIALCRILSDIGYNVVPFKSQNMSSKIYDIDGIHKISRVQAVQSFACGKKPDWRTNPILLVPAGDNKSKVFVQGKFLSEMKAVEYYKKFVLNTGFPIVLDALSNLRRKNDIVIIEGAGSPAEINIAKYDIANMLLADRIKSPIILVSDIERGGCFASIIGTIKLIKPKHRRLIKGFIINKFRGDETILYNATRFIEHTTKITNLGIIPKIDFNLPDEDSLDETRNHHDDQKLFNSKKILDKQINILANGIKEKVDIEFIIKNYLT